MSFRYLRAVAADAALKDRDNCALGGRRVTRMLGSCASRKESGGKWIFLLRFYFIW